MGGFEATALIRKYEKENERPRVPIIALTAHAMIGDREKCLSNDMVRYTMMYDALIFILCYIG